MFEEKTTENEEIMTSYILITKITNLVRILNLQEFLKKVQNALKIFVLCKYPFLAPCSTWISIQPYMSQ